MITKAFKLPKCLVLSGPSGCGKSAVGEVLAKMLRSLGLRAAFVDADDFHLPAIKRRTSTQVVPIPEEERTNWLGRIGCATWDWVRINDVTVLACSSLRSWFRQSTLATL